MEYIFDKLPLRNLKKACFLCLARRPARRAKSVLGAKKERALFVAKFILPFYVCFVNQIAQIFGICGFFVKKSRQNRYLRIAQKAQHGFSVYFASPPPAFSAAAKYFRYERRQ